MKEMNHASKIKCKYCNEMVDQNEGYCIFCGQVNKRELEEKYALRNVSISKLIKIDFNAGEGTRDDPDRVVTKYFDLEGKQVITIDPFNLKEN